MIELTVEGFRQRFPEFKYIQDDSVIQRAITMAGLQFDYAKCEKVDPTLAEEIGYLLTAHWLTINTTPGTGTTKTVSSESLGSASKSYGSPTTPKFESDPFMATKYGQQFTAIFRTNCAGFGASIV